MFEALGAPGIGAEALIASLTSPGMAAGLVIGASVTLSVSLGAQKFIDWRERTRPMRACRAMLKREAARACAGHSELPWTLEESRPRFIAAGVRPAPEGVRAHGVAATRGPEAGPDAGSEPSGAGNLRVPASPALVFKSPEPFANRVPAAGRGARAGVAPDASCGADRPALQRMMPPLDTGGPHLDMRAIDHVSEYLAHERMASLGRNALTGRWECKRSSGSVIASYHAWAKARSLRVIPEWQFLNLLADQEGVDKSRDRLKDASGRVLKNERGTPLRTNYYTIFELPQAVPHSRSRPPEADVRRRRVA